MKRLLQEKTRLPSGIKCVRRNTLVISKRFCRKTKLLRQEALYIFCFVTLHPLRVESRFRFVLTFHRKPFYLCELVSLFHTLFQNQARGWRAPSQLRRVTITRMALSLAREGSSYGENAANTIRTHPIKFKHLDCHE